MASKTAIARTAFAMFVAIIGFIVNFVWYVSLQPASSQAGFGFALIALWPLFFVALIAYIIGIIYAVIAKMRVLIIPLVAAGLIFIVAFTLNFFFWILAIGFDGIIICFLYDIFKGRHKLIDCTKKQTLF